MREPKGLACPNFEERFPTFDATVATRIYFQGQKVKVQVHQTHYCSQTSYAISSERQGLRTSNSVYGWRTTTESATGAMTSKVKDQGRKVTWSVWAVLAQWCTCVIKGRREHTVSAEPGGHISCFNRSFNRQFNAVERNLCITRRTSTRDTQMPLYHALVEMSFITHAAAKEYLKCNIFCL